MDAAAYFKLLATLMKDNPPTPADAPMVAQMAKIGLVPGNDWDISTLDPTIAQGVAAAPKAALAKIMAYAPNAGKVVNGWQITMPAGVYGTDYLRRAFLNLLGPGWNRPEDAVYPLARVDSEGKTLSGAHEYVIHFAKGEQPPVKGFWSLTMYDPEGFFVPNPLDRVNLSQRDKFNFNERWVARPLHPERLTRQGQGGQLAAVPQGRLWAYAATLLAEREGPLNPGRVLDAAPGASRQIASGTGRESKTASSSCSSSGLG